MVNPVQVRLSRRRKVILARRLKALLSNQPESNFEVAAKQSNENGKQMAPPDPKVETNP